MQIVGRADTNYRYYSYSTAIIDYFRFTAAIYRDNFSFDTLRTHISCCRLAGNDVLNTKCYVLPQPPTKLPRRVQMRTLYTHASGEIDPDDCPPLYIFILLLYIFTCTIAGLYYTRRFRIVRADRGVNH